MEINRLGKDELAYELEVRGVEEEISVAEMRQALRGLLKLGKGTSFVYPDHPFAFDVVAAALESLIAQIMELTSTFADVKNSPAYAKIETKLAHAFGRVSRCVPTTNDQVKRRAQLQLKIVALESKLVARTRAAPPSSTLVDPYGEVSLAELELPDSASDEEIDKEGSAGAWKSVPVIKWGERFSGERRLRSVNSFLERVDELRVARNVSKSQLIMSAVDLFEGNALVWFRANRSLYRTWDELVVGLREEFLPVHYEEKLLDEIKRRTQGQHESIGEYFACMTLLFSRLTSKLTEEYKVTLLLRNILPFYQSQLALTEVKTVSGLQRLCRRLDQRKESIQCFTSPPRRNQSLEPDLAYVDTEPSRRSMAASSPARVNTVANASTRTCWNCGKPGHLASRCTAPRKLRCYKCNEPGVTSNTCPKCSSGNARRVP